MQKLPITDIKEKLQGFFLDANTVGASPIDLSSGLSTRVRTVYKVNPERIQMNASLYPLVTIFIDDKDIKQATIAKNKLTAKKEGIISVKIVGAVWNDSFTEYDEDPADDDCENLMENIEYILDAHTMVLNAPIVTMQQASRVTYHSYGMTENNHLRFGIMDLQLKAYY